MLLSKCKDTSQNPHLPEKRLLLFRFFTLFNILPVGLAHAGASPNASNRREQPTPKSSLKGRGHEGAMPLHL